MYPLFILLRFVENGVQLKIDEVFAEREILADDSVQLLDEIMEGLDYTPLMRAYKRTGRRPVTNPVTMLKILVYAVMQGIFSSRDIAMVCRRDINFIWLLNGAKAPNHSEIARFRSKRLTECGEERFYQLVEKLWKLGEIKYEHHRLCDKEVRLLHTLLSTVFGCGALLRLPLLGARARLVRK